MTKHGVWLEPLVGISDAAHRGATGGIPQRESCQYLQGNESVLSKLDAVVQGNLLHSLTVKITGQLQFDRWRLADLRRWMQAMTRYREAEQPFSRAKNCCLGNYGS